MTRPVPLATWLTLGYGVLYLGTGLWLLGLLIVAWRQQRKHTH